MFTDHLPVADGRSQETTRQSTRLKELLDREILPRLERPGRFLATPKTRGLDKEPACASRAALVWPSQPESNILPDALEPLSNVLEALWGFAPAFACLPPTELEAALRQFELPAFTSDQWNSLVDYDMWIVWLEHPSQLLGVLTVLELCGLAAHASDRDSDAPELVCAGPAVVELAVVQLYADRVLLGDASSCAEQIAEAKLPRAESPRLSNALTPAYPSSLNEPFYAWSIDRGGYDRLLLRPWSAASTLLEDAADRRTQLTPLLHEIRERPELTLAARFALGLPGESDSDRWAILDWAEEIIDAAELDPPRLTVELVAYVDPMAAAPILDLAPWFEALNSELRGMRCRVELGDPSANWSGWCLQAAGDGAEEILRELRTAGVRSADSALARDANLWHKALQAVDFDGQALLSGVFNATAETSRPVRPSRAAPAPTDVGNEPARSRKPRSREAAEALPSPRQAGPHSRADRWRRWASIAPRHFDYRIEYSKRGRWRHLSQRELAELLLDATRSLGLPVATMGIAQRRPRISFGPSLPVGVEGLHEYVDLSFTRKHDQLQAALIERLPEGIDIVDIRFRPRAGAGLGLGEIARGEYRAEIPLQSTDRSSISDLCQRARTLERDSKRARAALAANPGIPPDPIHQLVDLRVDENTVLGSSLPLQFTLQLDSDGRKLKPLDLLQRLLGDSPLDPRMIPMQRTRLLASAEKGRDWLTPMEQIIRHLRELRARAKRCA